MSDLFWLTDEQMERLRPFFPRSHGKPRVDDRRVLSGIIFVNRNGLRWRDAPTVYGPSKTLYNRWKRWGAMGIFVRMMEGLARIIHAYGRRRTQPMKPEMPQNRRPSEPSGHSSLQKSAPAL